MTKKVTKRKKLKEKEHEERIKKLQEEVNRLIENEPTQVLVECKFCGTPVLIHSQTEIHVCIPCFAKHGPHN